jgi:hypothetical protein
MATTPRKPKSKVSKTSKAAVKKAAVKSTRAKKSASKKPAKNRPKTAAERMAARRARLRAQGLKPVTFWLPDVKSPKIRAQIRREGALLAQHPENAEIDAWIEAIYELDD